MLGISAATHFRYFTKGIKEAFNWNRVISLITTSKSIQHTLLKSLALNGVVYLGIIIVLEAFYNTPDHHLFGKIAQHQATDQQTSISLASSINTIILYGNFALFITFLRYIPFVGSMLSFLTYCIVMAYYCFEYKWMGQDWTIEQRMVYAEEHWAYCLGFGLPATTIIFFLSTLRAGGVFALVYPNYIMMASVASPEPLTTHSMANSVGPFVLPFRIPVFFAIRLMNQAIIQAIRTLGGSKAEAFGVEKKKHNLGKLV
ncbi:hypothetical protein [Parasitella parasitica]|uniref:Uncharacterized protein n=1 Tax=Parasitella parasitica TaxID=35722 RepID=A0A0B7MWE5_9FUNG|nr:hypothetical protein [Parasitella parasitica]